jgi:outer membrane protein OmpA-like peptidoglycan-associated protein
MRKIIIISLALGLFSFAAQAQDTESKDQLEKDYAALKANSEVVGNAPEALKLTDAAYKEMEDYHYKARGAYRTFLRYNTQMRIAQTYAAAAAAKATAETKELQTRYDFMMSERAKAMADAQRMLAEQQASTAAQAQQVAEGQAKEASMAAREAALDAKEAQLQAKEAQVQMLAMSQELQDLKAKQTDRGMVVTLGSALFQTDSATLKAGAQKNLGQLAEYMTEFPQSKATIEGHTDNTGDPAYNQQLSEQRAQAVANYLTGNGVAAFRVSAEGLGQEYPIAPNDTEAGRQANRRVEVILTQ